MTKRFETARGTVHEWQCDHMGHANVRAFGEFFEEACWQVYNRVGITPTLLRSGRFHMAAVQQDISYKKELLAGDVVEVHSAIVEIRDKVLKFAHELRNTETGELCGTSVFTVVCLDQEARKARPFPEEIAAKARALLADSPPGT
ncbi:MAG: acyl-CoA thioesterase [Burkholderiales bacterium]|jgi:acyl-CoA thioester hydrolase|nr:acyl-CoA thioesterase [Burkholderiales bacterium]